MPKKILIITPKFPLPTTGACEQERLAGFLQLQRLGYDVMIIAKVFDWQDKEAIYQWSQEHGIKVDLMNSFPNEGEILSDFSIFNFTGSAPDRKTDSI